jgi:phosphate transport system substrate-binding protein
MAGSTTPTALDSPIARARRRRLRLRILGAALGVIAAMVSTVLSTGPASAASAHALIEGSGSSWSSNAVNQWVADVHASGLQVVYTASGSAQGRKDFAFKTTDFAVSDIGYLGVDPVSGDQDTSMGRAFAYLPIVAGGTSFPYHLSVGGQLVTNLRLSGLTLAKIFTNQITNWNDPAITADNNGRKFPSIPIIPVVHSEGSGSSAQFTQYLTTSFSSLWTSYQGVAGSTEYFPRKGPQIAQNGSDGVMNFIASSAANGAIGYDEYSYALAAKFPVAKLENSAGYFTAPTQYAVAVALVQAIINNNPSDPNYLLQDLHNVYVDPDPRAYAMSSYSYMIIPTSPTDSRMTTPKRQTLADFLYYSICQGQAEMGPIGYSPLPINLVQASFNQTAKLKAADPNVNLTSENVATCHNPTFDAANPALNYLAQIAPQPPACDKSGAGPCSGSVGIVNNNPVGSKAPTAPGGSGAGAGAAGGGGAASNGASAGASPGSSAAGGVDATGTNSVAGSGGFGDSGGGGGDAAGAAQPTDVAEYHTASSTSLLSSLAVIELVAIIAIPPLLVRFLTRRRGRRT